MAPAYTVQQPIKFGGTRREPGEAVDMPEAVGEPLVASGHLAAGASAKSEEPPAGDGGGTDAEKRDGQIKAAVAKLVADKKGLTADGKPRTEAVEKLVGFDITAAERDTAFAALESQA